jgi:sugar phosphate isomerase/epimerase
VARLLSIAAGVHPMLPPEEMVSASAAAGWPACGIWFDGATWTDATTRGVKRRLDDTGIIALDIEPIIPSDGGDDHAERLIAAAAELGIGNILFTSRLKDQAATTARYAECCDMALPHGIRVVCEFLPIFPLNSLPMAKEIVAAANRPNGGILIDNLHLSRSGGTPADVAALDLSLMPYIQIADAPAGRPESFESLLDEAINGRLCPGEGGLPIAELLTVVPDVPISFEVRSKFLRENFTDPVERARHLLKMSSHLA